MNAEIDLLATGRFQAGFKRAMDICGALLGLALFGPLILLIALALSLESSGKVFFRQERLGYGGRKFTILKFLSMRAEAEEHLEAMLSGNPNQRARFELYQKLDQDPRLTRLGKILRRTSLDELPQLWNVLKGDMSLVGPRPILPSQRELYGPAYFEYRRMLPGITGLWQVSGRNQLSFQERAELDRKYFQEWSLWSDIEILARTPWAVIRQKGAY